MNLCFTKSIKPLLATLLLSGLLVASPCVAEEAESLTEQRATAAKLMKEGNWKDAYEIFNKLATNKENNDRTVVSDLQNAISCSQRLGKWSELDDLLEKSVETHKDNWRLLYAAANHYLNTQHQGYLISGEYKRGGHRGGGKMMNSMQRDRVRALQLYSEAIPLTREEDIKSDVANFYLALGNAMMYNRGQQESWRLQYLTDLGELPDLEEGYPYYRNYNGAPVDEDGEPVFHKTVRKWEDAETDGQRWRWALDQAMENDPSKLNQVRYQFANFIYQQFGVQTMANYGYGRFFGRQQQDEGENESGTYALHTLDSKETIAKLATGIKRFKLDDEYNFISIFEAIAAEPKTGYGEQSLHTLARLYLNRRQYEKAASYWQQSIDEYGPGNNDYKKKQIEQITSNWGTFENVTTQAAGEGATVEFRFRNGDNVKFTAKAIKMEELLTDVKAYLKRDPGRLDWQQMQIDNIGYRMVQQGEAKYLGEEVATWEQELEPREGHFDKRITIETPLKKSGAYLLTAKMENGNTSNIVLWVSDTAIVKKPLDKANMYFVADAATGAPIPGAELKFFGYQQQGLGNGKVKINTKEFTVAADEQGIVIPDNADLVNNHQWLVTTKTDGGRFAYYGFRNVWNAQIYDQEYKTTKIYAITDRPVYRPNQKVNFKLWLRHAQFDKENVSQFAGASTQVDIYNPMNEKVLSKNYTADEYGGIVGELELPEDAKLGNYRIQVNANKQNQRIGGGSQFRVEEYKKPEYEVTIDAPKEPVMLGEKITATINAKYYFGAPVTKGTVKYKIERNHHSQDFYPDAPWDWCFGPGYWWFCYDAPWYPGWHQWRGCGMPLPWWYHQNHSPPELVSEQEVEISEDGTVEVEIDTEVAKALHGNSDHKYTITAEVRDESRRTIVGVGNVLVARKPFKVFTWLDRGYYRVGDTVDASFLGQTLDKKAVTGKGVLTLLKITYDKANNPIETPVRRWDVDTDQDGRAAMQIRAASKGQYRLAYKLSDSKDHTIEGGYLFTIVGEGFDGKDYRFNEIELVPEKGDYAAGETVKLQVNANHSGGTVLLFVRPTNGVYLKPEIIKLDGKSTVAEIKVSKKDMPNFYVEAMTVSGGRIHTTTKEIIVPPEKRILNVDVIPSKTAYKPGEKAKMKIHVTDFTGENYSGQTVVSIYDKSVEYIASATTPDIKEFFWKWRRRHNPQREDNLVKHSGNINLRNQPGMSFLGVFGHSVADEFEAMESEDDDLSAAEGGNFAGGGGGPMMQRQGMAMADGAEMAMAAPMAPGAGMKADAVMTSAPTDKNAAAETNVEPAVRSNFADTALWVGALQTDKTGIAEIELDMPENLTTWKVKVWGMGHGTQVGSAEAEVITRKDVIVRLQAPRFFVQKDEVVLSANVHNYLDTEKEVTVVLETPGNLLQSLDETQRVITVAANGEQRVDWRVEVVNEGMATVRMKALTDEESDAMQMDLPCHVHGILKTEAWAGTVRPDDEKGMLTINVPAERKAEQSRLEVRYSPTLAGAMVDALPYLADYPYGCTEQTLNRFVPLVTTKKVLIDMNLDLASIKEKRTNLNAQEIGDDKERAEQWKRFDRNPVFDEDELQKMLDKGLTRLTNMQNGDGGWGWFSGNGGRSYPHTTAVVVHGLQIAQHNDAAMKAGMLDRGIDWLANYQAGEVQELKNAEGNIRPMKTRADNLDAFVYMVLVDAGRDNKEMREYLYRDRNDLSVHSKAQFGIALHKVEDVEKRDMIRKNIEQFLVEDEENETAYLELPEGTYWWAWYGNDVESNANYLKLLTLVDPEGKTAPRLVKYLLNNRKHSTYWNSTRDTATCVEAFADYIRATGEAQPDMTVEIWVDGQKRQEAKIDAENLFSFNNKFVLEGADVKDGEHTIEIRRTGKGPVYFNAYLTNFTMEDPIAATGLEIKVSRKYYKLNPVEKTVKVAGARGQAADQKVEKYVREEIESGAMLKSGDLVEVELTLESKNDYEYLIFEDLKAAGFEAVEVRSGYTDNGLRSYTEYRDDRVSFFLRQLARGKNSVAYRLRAEIPGTFSALPAQGYAMYAPELKTNSNEMKLKIED